MKNIAIIVLFLLCAAEPFLFGAVKVNRLQGQNHKVSLENRSNKEINSLRAQNTRLKQKLAEDENVLSAANKFLKAYKTPVTTATGRYKTDFVLVKLDDADKRKCIRPSGASCY